MKATKIIACAGIALLALLGGRASAQNIAVKSNALMLAAGLPNAGLEVVTSDRTSLDFSVFGGYKPYTLDIKAVGVQPEFRFWLSGRAMAREYVGVTVLGLTYDMRIKDKTYDGDALGFGLTFGYAWPLTARCNVEFAAGIGGYLFRHVQHSVRDNQADYIEQGYDMANASGFKILPSKLSVTFTYIFK